MSDMLRRESLRRQLDLMTEITERIMAEPLEQRKRWVDALMPLTETILRELTDLEWGENPYKDVVLAHYFDRLRDGGTQSHAREFLAQFPPEAAFDTPVDPNATIQVVR